MVNLPPGKGIYQSHTIHEEKNLFCAAKSPISFWAMVPTNMRIIIQTMVTTKIRGSFKIRIKINLVIDIWGYYLKCKDEQKDLKSASPAAAVSVVEDILTKNVTPPDGIIAPRNA